MFDLWGENTIRTKKDKLEDYQKEVKDDSINLNILKDSKQIVIASKKDLSSCVDFEHLKIIDSIFDNDTYYYFMSLLSGNAFVLRHFLKGFNVIVDPLDAKELTVLANKQPACFVELNNASTHVNIVLPGVKMYHQVLQMIDARRQRDGSYNVRIDRLLDMMSIFNSLETRLPLPRYSDRVMSVVRAPIKGFDGSLQSLRSVALSELHVIAANPFAFKKTNKTKTLEERFHQLGISNLYDLLHWLPRHYIDKSNPQRINDLMIGENTVLLGEIKKIGKTRSGKDVVFTISHGGSRTVSVTFWRQHWLENKFSVGDEVLITGKVGYYNDNVTVSGVSIENAKEAAVLPIVPIYKQSASKEVKTTIILAAIRELLSRINLIELPVYLKPINNVTYHAAYKELHLPSNVDNLSNYIDFLAYQELVYIQLLIQNEKLKTAADKSVKINSRLSQQQEIIESLPFELTGSQKKAIGMINEKVNSDVSSNILLNADVGAGKSLVAQLSLMNAVEANYQAVIVCPTDVLARQMFSTTQKTLGLLKTPPRIVYYSGSMKAKERKETLALIKNGEAQVIVGTHSVFSDKVEYDNLGFVVIDEQQKFGAEQRTSLKNRRKDNKSPHFLFMTATPIPRSVAQAFYGDINMVLLDEKPPGRLPIITEWVQENPINVVGNPLNHMWEEIRKETMLGNQSFIISPLVSESNSEVASVEYVFKQLSNTTLKDLRIAFVHGKLKIDDQRAIMTAFRNKEFDVLVASTVVEVGVDIPDATRVVVLSADRLGASQLHQIRGRVGRNNKQSKCYLVSDSDNDATIERLTSLVNNQDGFEVAKNDLLARGEGNIFGSTQSGSAITTFANLRKHLKWVDKAQEEAVSILESEHREIALKDANEFFETYERLM